MNAAKPARPVPSKTIENGSGTPGGVTVSLLKLGPVLLVGLIVIVPFAAEGANAVLLNDATARESV